MIMNNLDPEVAQFPQELVTYGGNGQCFSNWAQVRLFFIWREKFNLPTKINLNLRRKQSFLHNIGVPVRLLQTRLPTKRSEVTRALYFLSECVYFLCLMSFTFTR